MEVAYLTLLAWIPVVIGLFAVLRPVRALMLAYLAGWLLLPMARIPIEGFWDIDKVLVTNVGVVIGALLFCPARFRSYKLCSADLALLVFVVGTGVTSLVNGLGVYDGASALTHKFFYYAVPYVLGRAFLRNQRELLIASRLIVFAAALYAVLALWEWRMSPHIHSALYGYFQHSWAQHSRWGFWRPIVCFPHALALGIFFAWTSLLAIWLMKAGQLRRFMRIPPAWMVILPILGLLVSMSMGPWIMFVAGFLLFFYRRWSFWRTAAWFPVLFSFAWMGGRYTNLSDGAWLSSNVSEVSAERSNSLQYRIDAETMLIKRAKQRPVFGWGGWGRNRVRNDQGRDLVATDGLWIILLGSYGLFGLASFFAWWCWPVVMITLSHRNLIKEPVLMALLVAIGLQSINLLFNGFLSPILILMHGGLVASLALIGSDAREKSQPSLQQAMPTYRIPMR